MLLITVCGNDVDRLSALEDVVRTKFGADCTLRVFSSLSLLTREMGEGLRPDIAVMDVALADGSGLERVKQLFPSGCRVQVIYLTDYVKYFPRVYADEHFHYIMKPVDSALLDVVLDKAVQSLREDRNRVLALRSGHTTLLVAPSSILYLESDGRKLMVCQFNGKLELYYTIPKLLSQLPRSFIQCHKSFAVNLEHIAVMERSNFVMENGERVPISRSRNKEVRKRFFEFFLGKLCP